MAIVMMNGREYGGTGITASSIGYYDTINIGANNVQDAITNLCYESRKDIASCNSKITNLTQRVGVIETTLVNAYNQANNAYNYANSIYANITALETKLPYNIVRKTQSQYNDLKKNNKIDAKTLYLIPIS